MSRFCTPDQAIEATAYLRHAFGGWEIPDQEQRAFRRMCLDYEPAEVQGAIDMLVKTAERRPSPNDISLAIRKSRMPARPDGPYLDELSPTELRKRGPVTEADDFASRMAELRDPDSELRRVGAHGTWSDLVTEPPRNHG